MIGTPRSVIVSRRCVSNAKRRVPSCTLAPLGLASVPLTCCAGGTKRALETRHDLEALHAEAVTAPQSPQPWYRMPLVHACQQRYDEALRAAQATLQRDADYRLRRGDVDECVRILEDLVRRNPELTTASSNLSLVLRHWLFDDVRAAAHEAQVLRVGAPQLGEEVVYELLVAGPGPEDAAPPAETKPDAAAEAPPQNTESSDDTSHE